MADENGIELTPLQRLEREAIVFDKEAVLEVVSALREYRSACKKLLLERYRDGECDAVSLHTFACAVEDIETLAHGEVVAAAEEFQDAHYHVVKLMQEDTQEVKRKMEQLKDVGRSRSMGALVENPSCSIPGCFKADDSATLPVKENDEIYGCPQCRKFILKTSDAPPTECAFCKEMIGVSPVPVLVGRILPPDKA